MVQLGVVAIHPVAGLPKYFAMFSWSQHVLSKLLFSCAQLEACLPSQQTETLGHRRCVHLPQELGMQRLAQQDEEYFNIVETSE